MNIVVLAGGVSTERDVSLSSGTKICKALRAQGHQAVLVDLFFGLPSLPDPVSDYFRLTGEPTDYKVPETAPDIAAIKAARKESGLGEIGKNVLSLCQAADMVFLGLHGENGENGRLQALLDIAGIRYTGSGYLGSALAMNKVITKQIFLQNSIPTPHSRTFEKGGMRQWTYGFPCVVKPCSGGSSVGVAIVRDEKAFAAALEDAFAYEDQVLVEQYIQGREFSVGVLGDMVLPPIEIIPKGEFYDYAHKYQAGWTEEICPARLDESITKAMQASALAAYRALRLAVYARVDFLLDAQGQFYCLEANTLPGMTPTSLLPQEAQAVGVDYTSLCQRIVTLSMEKYQ